MITLRRSDERGKTKLKWLDSRHTFSFGEYYDPQHMGFRKLRVINEDRVNPGAGFPMHSHRDMETITYVLEGTLAHQESTGTSSVIKAWEVQRMSAGTEISLSEYNASKTEPVHFLQIWIIPAEKGLKPGYGQRSFDLERAMVIGFALRWGMLVTIHDFVMLNALPEAAPPRAALTQAVDFLKSVLAPKRS